MHMIIPKFTFPPDPYPSRPSRGQNVLRTFLTFNFLIGVLPFFQELAPFAQPTKPSSTPSNDACTSIIQPLPALKPLRRAIFPIPHSTLRARHLECGVKQWIVRQFQTSPLITEKTSRVKPWIVRVIPDSPHPTTPLLPHSTPQLRAKVFGIVL